MRSDHLPDHLTWSLDSKSIYFLATLRGSTHLYEARPEEDWVPQMSCAGDRRIYGYSLDAAQKTLPWSSPIPLCPATSSPAR